MGEEQFDVSVSASTETKTCVKGEKREHGRTITVIDTPICDNKLSNEIKEYLQDGPNVFLLVLKVNDKVTAEMMDVLKWITENLGNDVLRYTIALFTHVDQLGEISLKDYFKNSNDLQVIINSIGGRYHPFICNTIQESRHQVTELLDVIDNMLSLMNLEQKKYNINWYIMAQKQRKRKDLGFIRSKLYNLIIEGELCKRTIKGIIFCVTCGIPWLLKAVFYHFPKYLVDEISQKRHIN